MGKQLFELCLDHIKGDVSKHDKENYALSNEGIRIGLFDLMGLEPTDKWGVKEIRAFRANRDKVYTLIEEVIDQSMPDFIRNNEFFDTFVDYKQVDFGEEQGFYVEDNSLFTVSEFSGHHWDTRREKVEAGQSLTIPTKWYTVHFYAEFIQVMTGKVDFSRLIAKARKSILKFYADQVAASFYNAVSYLPTELSPAGSYSTDAIRSLVTAVSAANDGSDVVIAGTRAMLEQLAGGIDDQWVSGNMADEKNNTGVLRMWDGNRLMVLPTRMKKDTYTVPEDNQNVLFFLPVGSDDKPIKVVNEGGALTRAITVPQGNQDMTTDEQIQFKMGAGVTFGDVIATYTIV